jgi:hypothetical protein
MASALTNANSSINGNVDPSRKAYPKPTLQDEAYSQPRYKSSLNRDTLARFSRSSAGPFPLKSHNQDQFQDRHPLAFHKCVYIVTWNYTHYPTLACPQQVGSQPPH